MKTRAGTVALVLLAACTGPPAPPPEDGPPDLVLVGGRVWTVDAARPEAEAVAVRGERILAVGAAAAVRALAAPGQTRVIELEGRLVLPGFIDNHVHFAQAGHLLLGVNLLDVNEPEAFRERVAEAARRLPPGAWLVGGNWGAYAQWAMGSSGVPGDGGGALLEPDRGSIDAVTGDHPALISRFDGQVHLANSLALEAAGIDRETSDPEGGEIVRDPSGQPTGLLRGRADSLVRAAIPPHAQRRAEALAGLERARSRGVTGFHDNVADFAQLELLRDLLNEGALTARVWARMPLQDWKQVDEYVEDEALPAVRGGWGDDWIRLGGLKAWVDGIMGNSTALFFEPYDHRPDESGRLRDVMFPEGNLERLITGADAAGFTVTVHAIGDQANHILLDTYSRVFAAYPTRPDRRHRVVHAQVVRRDDLRRFGELGLVAEVQPYHCIDDMRWMEERIGERATGAYRFRSLHESSARLTFGSDWPGTNASWYPIDPLLGIYAAVTRQTLEGEPEGGWHPDERIGVAEAIEAYTLSNAWSTYEEQSRGSITPGKLADLVVIDRDVIALPPEELTQARVLYTIVGGKVVFEARD